MAGAISSYPGAAGPVSGTVAPMLMLVAVTPGTFDAVVVVVALGDELHAASVVAPRAPVSSARPYLPMEVCMLCLIVSLFLMAYSRLFASSHPIGKVQLVGTVGHRRRARMRSRTEDREPSPPPP